jgi:hypothetical protein
MYDRVTDRPSAFTTTTTTTMNRTARPHGEKRRLTIMDPIMDPADLDQARRTKGLVVRTLNDGLPAA